MAEVKWIKIVVNIFDDEKIKLIDAMPECDAIIVIWFKLLCLAGKQSNRGVLMLNERIAYTDEMLAATFNRPLNTVRLALSIFEQYGMIQIVDNVVTIPNWEKHQSLDSYERRKEADRIRKAEKRAEQRQIAQSSIPVRRQSADGPQTVSLLDKDIDLKNIASSKDKVTGIRESSSKDNACAEPQSDSTPEAIICITLNDKTEFPIYQDQIAEWQSLYPAVDVLQELRTMRGWCLANPARRKTKRGVLAFVNRWLAKAQDQGGASHYRPQNNPGSSKATVTDMLAAALTEE